MRKVPKLRFKEFKDEWEEKKLGEFGKISMCKRIMKDQTTLIGDIPFYKIGTFGKKADAYIDKKLFEEYKEKYSFPKKGDILLSASGTIGRTVIYDGKPAYFQDSNIVWIATNEKIILNSFLNYLYSNIKWTTENTTIARLYNDNLANMKVNIPFLQEQEKIANFLSNVDKKISLTEEKLELFREYKKVVMQKIFSQELRFKDSEGNDYPEWEEKKLVEIGDTYNGLTGKSAEDFGRGKKYITYKNIYDNTKINMNILELVNIELEEKQNKVEYGDIFFTTSSETQNEVGYSSVLLDKVQEDIYLNSFCFGFRLKDKAKYLPEFFRYLLRSQNFRNSIYILAQGSTRFNLSKIELLKLKVLLPVVEEQQKIADFLSSIDNKIESIEKELEGLKEFKKGLLQQMFV